MNDLHTKILGLKRPSYNGRQDYGQLCLGFRLGLEAAAEHVAAEPAQSGEERAEQIIQASIDNSPEPLKKLGEWLARVLDEDQWPTAERLLLAATLSLEAPQAEHKASGEVKPHGYELLHSNGEVTFTKSRDLVEAYATAGVASYTALYTSPVSQAVPEELLMAAFLAGNQRGHESTVEGYWSPACGDAALEWIAENLAQPTEPKSAAEAKS